MLQVLFDDFQRLEKSISIVLICVFKKSGFKILLKLSAFFDNGKCLFRTLKFDLPPVSFYTVSGQISFFYQFIYIDRNKIGFDFPDFHDVAGCFAFRIVAKKHKNIKGCLRHMNFFT